MSNESAKKLAKRFFDYHQLSLPVDIEEVVNRYATVIETDIPVNGDAVCINCSDKPQIFIKQAIPLKRKRFTYAHELGHIQIPSHTGMISCDTDLADSIDMSVYNQMENEANSFAGELLMPSNWINKLINERSDLTEVIELVCNTAHVSFMAAVYNVISVAPENYMFYIRNKIDDYAHFKQGSNSYWPMLIVDSTHEYDYDWIRYNSKTIKDIDKESMNVKIFEFKKVLDRESIIKVANQISSNSNCQKVCDELVSSDTISFAHLFIQISQYLAKGIILKIKYNATGSHSYILASGTIINPRIHTELEKDSWYDENSCFNAQSMGINISMKVWFFNTNFEYKLDQSDTRDSKSILRSIIETSVNKSKRVSAYGIINGTISSLSQKNDRNKLYTKEQFFNVLKQKFMSRTDISSVTQHNDFDQYLAKKTNEIFQL